MKDPHGLAILNYYKGDLKSKLILNTSYGPAEEMPIEVFFREPEDFTDLENQAISECLGKILDLGAGAGAHSLLMQTLGMDITAMDNSPGCVETMTKSGLNNVVSDDYQIHKQKYDTLLLLMNGIGIAGKLDGIPIFLNKCKDLLNEGGQIILDSSDISYLYEDGTPKPEGYYGEIKYQYEYNGQTGDWFDWVYIDQTTLTKSVTESGLKLEILMVDENDQYLARITGF